jgi:hypothetical protein
MNISSYISFTIFSFFISIGLYDFYKKDKNIFRKLFVLKALVILFLNFSYENHKEMFAKSGVFLLCLFFATYYSVLSKENKYVSLISPPLLIAALILITYSSAGDEDGMFSQYTFIMSAVSIILISIVFYDRYYLSKEQFSDQKEFVEDKRKQNVYFFTIFFLIYSSFIFL